MTTPHQEGEDSANFYQVGQMIECSNCHPQKYTGHQKTCNCKCHVPTTQNWKAKLVEALELGGDIIDFEGELRPQGLERLLALINSTK